MGCETIGTRNATDSDLCTVETPEGADEINNEGSVLVGPHAGESYLLTGPYRGERASEEGVLTSGPLAGHRVGPCIQLGDRRYAEMSVADSDGRPVSLSGAEVARLESAFSTEGAVLLDGESLSPGQVCIDTAQQGRTLSAFRRFTDGSTYSSACLGLFDESRSEDARRTLCSGLVESLYTGLPPDLRLSLSVPSLSGTSSASHGAEGSFPFWRELGALLAAVVGFHYGQKLLSFADGKIVSAGRSFFASVVRYLGWGGNGAEAAEVAETAETAAASQSAGSSLGSRLVTAATEVAGFLGAVGTFLSTPIIAVVPDCGTVEEMESGSCGGESPGII